MSQVFLIRHGQASFGAKNYDNLSPLGEQQSALLGSHFNQRAIKPQTVISGYMQRHQQTLAGCQQNIAKTFEQHIILSQLNEFDHQEVLHRFDERFSDPVKMKQFLSDETLGPRAFIQQFYLAISRWQSGMHDNDYQETWAQFSHRIEVGLALITEHALAQEKPVLVFTSGGVISRIVCMILGLDDDKLMMFNKNLYNCSISEIKVSSKRAQVVTLNEHGIFAGKHAHLKTLL